MERKTKTSIRLKEIMNLKDLKQKDVIHLCEPFYEKYKVKLGRNDISQYLSGKNEPGQRKIMLLSEALDVSPSWLLGLDDSINFNKNKEICINYIHKLLIKNNIIESKDKKLTEDDIEQIIVFLKMNNFKL